MNDLWDEVEPYPDVAPALARIQEMGVPILVYSNVETEYLDMMVAKLAPFAPDFVGDMEKSHSRKPSPFAYRWVLDTAGRRLGMDLYYPDILYVAGPQWDVQAAMSLGMKGVWIHRFYGAAVSDAHRARSGGSRTRLPGRQHGRGRADRGEERDKMETYGEYDVVVAGGGTSGVWPRRSPRPGQGQRPSWSSGSAPWAGR